MAEGTQLGKYTLKRRLATGGMAEIWLAEQRGPGGFAKELVVKQILPHLANDEKFVQMFLDEARLAAQLTHPNIVQIYDLGEADGSYFIAMEYIRGHDLEQLLHASLQAGVPLDPLASARIVADACAGLDFAHNFADNRGRPLHLVHRDVSPQNILVSDQGAVKLVDFGVAKAAISTHKTQTGAVKGKFAYMSPEQISGKELDGRSDLFAMGIVLFELLTGKRPFGHESELMAVTAILHHPAPDVAELNPSTPDALRDVVARALEKDPTQRWQTAEAMQQALEEVLAAAGQPVNRKTLAVYLGSLVSGSPKSLASSVSTMPTNVGGGRATEEGVPFSLRHGPGQPGPGGPPADPWAAGAGQPSAPAPAGQPGGPPPGVPAGSTPPRGAGSPTLHGRPTQRVEPKPGVSNGLKIAIALVFLALAGAGYFLYDTVMRKSGGEVSEGSGGAADTGTVAEADAGDGVANRPDAGETVATQPDAGVTPPLVPDAGAVVAELDAAPALDAAALPEADATGPVAVADVGAGLMDALVVVQNAGDASALTDDAGPTLDDAGAVASADAEPGTDAGGPLETDATVVASDDAGTAADVAPTPDAGVVAMADTGVVATTDAGEPATDTGPTTTEDAAVVATTDTGAETPVQPDAGEADAQVALADTGGTEPAADAGSDDAGAVAVVEDDAGGEEPDAEEETETHHRRHDDEEDDRRPGSLMVVVSPPGRYEILVDGEVVGRTPMPRHNLPAGRHRVEVRRVGERETRGERVRIRPGRTETVRIEMD